jgi:hypothetical protein
VEVFSGRLYQRQVARLDLELLHYVYDNTGPGSKLRALFTHVSAWYGNPDVFAQMAKEMPPVFYADYAAKEADRALKLRGEVSINPWDLTEFLLSEVSIHDGIDMVNFSADSKEEDSPKRRSDSPIEDRHTKRKRSCNCGS